MSFFNENFLRKVHFLRLSEDLEGFSSIFLDSVDDLEKLLVGLWVHLGLDLVDRWEADGFFKAVWDGVNIGQLVNSLV